MSGIINYWLKPRLLCIAPKDDIEESITPMQIGIRILVALITASWISFIPFYLFLIYMYHNDFFSYDFFVEGVFGLNIFIIASALFLVFMSLYFYGFILVAKLGIIEQKKKKKNSYRWGAWALFLLSLLMHYFLFIVALSQNKLYMLFWIMGASAIFTTFFYSFIGHGIKYNTKNYLAPILFIAVSILVPFFQQSATSGMVSIGLKGFNMGGGKSISIEDISNKVNPRTIEGKLTLLTPNNAYLKSNIDGKLMIVPISSHTIVKIW